MITGTSTGTVVEAGGVANGTPGTPTATGDLLATDVDNTADAFQAVAAGAATTNHYGTYGVTASGVWTYTLDDTNAAVQALNDSSAPLTDSFTVLSEDGTATVVMVTINGTNDAAVLSADVAELVETDAVLSTGGTLDDQRRRQRRDVRGAGRHGRHLWQLLGRCGRGVELHGQLGTRRVRGRGDLHRHLRRGRVPTARTTSVTVQHPRHQRCGGALGRRGGPGRNRRGAEHRRHAHDQRRRQRGDVRGAARHGRHLWQLLDRRGRGVELHGEQSPTTSSWPG